MLHKFSLVFLIFFSSSKISIFGNFLIILIKYSLSFDVEQTAPFNVGIPVPLFLSNTLDLFCLILNRSILSSLLLFFLSIIPTIKFSSLLS